MKVLVVHCHPSPESFVTAARDRVLTGLQAAGHDTRLVDLYAEGFDPLLRGEELAGFAHLATTRPAHDPAARSGALLRWCEALVLVYPTWWSGQPAMLTGWFDRVLVPGVAYEVPAPGARLQPRLTNIRRLVVVTSHGSTKWVNAIEGEGGKRVVGRAVRVLCHRWCRTTWLAIYDIDRADDAARRRFLTRVESRMRRLRRGVVPVGRR